MIMNNKIAVFMLLAIAIASVAPTSAKFYAEHKTEKFVDLADKAGCKVNNILELIYVNQTALETIEAEGFKELLKGNVTLYDEGVKKVTNAYTSLEIGDYEDAVANATEALQIFREVFKSLNVIMEQTGIQRGQLVDDQGLIVAMQRGLERIERLQEILPEEETEAQELLDNAAIYLNVEVARTWLREGRVKETAYNLTQATRLIAQAHKLLKNIAKEMNAARFRNYLKGVTKATDKITIRLENARRKGLNTTKILQELGYENATQFRQHLQNMILETREKRYKIKDTIQELNQIHKNLQKMERNLRKLEQQQNHGKGGVNGNGQNNGNGHGNNKP